MDIVLNKRKQFLTEMSNKGQETDLSFEEWDKHNPSHMLGYDDEGMIMNGTS